MNWVLLGVILVFLACIALGCKKGLVKMLFSTGALILIVAITILVGPKAVTILQERTTWDEKVYEQTGKYLGDLNLLMSEDNESFISEKLDALWLPDAMKEPVISQCSEYVNQGAGAFNRFLTEKVANAVFAIMVYAGVILAASLLVVVLEIILINLVKIPGIKEANRLGGAVLGFFVALLIVEVAFVVLAAFAQTEFGSFLNDQIQSNVVLKYIYDTNPILLLVARFL